MDRDQTPPDVATASPTGTVARRLREVRKRRDLTAQQLADRVADLGVPMNRAVLVKIENGRRENISVAELLGFALALDCSPLSLLLPTDNSPYAVTPTRTEPANDVRDWVRGRQPLPGMDEQAYRHEVSVQDLQRRVNPERGYLLPDEEVKRQNQALAEQMEEMARRLRGE
ncbi:helix-turn-helix domain-containing protein [Streptomyces sp. BH106]|uniref:helix-turn-helix domain-containing protein n=1 Tax=Streptomyces sp. BH106 TaxID=3410409 RepID=UPI003CE8FBCC